ncbi:MAG TPA: hypothetical protein VFX02_13660 [Gammaproteobacteria bacterium]|nr:hypothetical protein [Gammaproteobacteria bacterium]
MRATFVFHDGDPELAIAKKIIRQYGLGIEVKSPTGGVPPGHVTAVLKAHIQSCFSSAGVTTSAFRLAGLHALTISRFALS